MIYFYILLLGLAINCIFVGMAIESESPTSLVTHFIFATLFCCGIILEVSNDPTRSNTNTENTQRMATWR